MLFCMPGKGNAEGFSVLVAPPRFELQANPGDTVRDHVEITNPGDSPITFLMRTADWDMTEEGKTTFYPPELQPGSCRPMVRIERHKIRLPAKGKKRYRFQIELPEDALPGECRVALLIESPPEDAVQAKASSLTLPIRGRIAIVIYIAIGGAKPDLEISGMGLELHGEKPRPVIIVKNTGNAHGRTAGYVEATDATGKRFDFEITPLPVLAGQTRRIPLYQPTIDDRTPDDFTPPLELSAGALEWGDSSTKIEKQKLVLQENSAAKP
ncbi:MAG: hypothetical protein GQ537_02620 [Gammaproteobacteria bacterium]|nr:hypothetical protein [Gammaproteobacteria bacterium]